MGDLPEGVVTFLFTDVEGSTRLWEDAPDSMMEALRQHDEAIEGAALDHRGVPVRPRGEGDSRFIVFPAAPDAVAAAADIQQRLASTDWATPDPLRVRVSLHTGVADLQLGDYYGSSVNRAARLRGIAHGGQTLMSGATWELVQDHLPSAVTVQDMGEHRLKDLTRPEHVYQMDVTGLDEQFPPLDSLDSVPNNLPVQLTDFIGRPEVEDIKGLVGGTRLVTILAPGGAGKTRAAIQAAAELIADFPDGVFFIDLAPITAPGDIAQTAAESIGVALATDEDLQTQLLAHLANERQLLVFDNFEHLADGVEIVTEILKAAPGVKVVATSRTKLNITGESVFALPGLEIEWHSEEEAFRASGVHLFIDAGKRADATFSLRIADLDPLHRILGLVGGMPLGILLAASWVDTLRVEEIADEISRSMDFLETDTRDMPDRHQSMRAVFDYSWSMLSEDEQRTYDALSVFRGGFTRDAALDVAGTSLRALSNLASKSLVIADRDAGRYAIHELLRQYAEEELRRDQDRWEATMVAHNTFFAGHLAQVEHMVDAGEEPAALRLVEDDLDNVRRAWRQALARADAPTARPITYALWILYEIRGWTKAGAELFAEVHDAFAPDTNDESAQIVRAMAAGVEAKFITNLGHPEAAKPLAVGAVATLRPLSDPAALIMAIESLCEILFYLGDYDEMLPLSEEAIELAEEVGNDMWKAGMKSYQAGTYLASGDLETAAGLLREGDEILARLDENFMRSWNLEMQASIAMAQGRVGDAIALRNHMTELAREVGYVRAEALAFQGLGGAYTVTAETDKANDALLQSLAMFAKHGLLVDMAAVLIMIGRVRAASGDAERAVELVSCVLADPTRSQQFVAEHISIEEAATALLAQLEAELDPEALAAAQVKGAATGLDVMVKELLANT